jgi:hypothetical protein
MPRSLRAFGEGMNEGHATKDPALRHIAAQADVFAIFA